MIKHMRVIVLLMTTLIPLLISGHTVAKGKDMKALFNNPYFTVNIKSFGTMYLAHINGVSIQREYDSDGQMSTSFPVNHLMRSGENELILEILPPSQSAEINPNSYVSMELLVAPNNDKENTFSIATIDFKGNMKEEGYTGGSTPSGQIDSTTGNHVESGGDVKISDITLQTIQQYNGGIRFERKLDVPSSLPEWAFFTSDDIPDLDKMSDEEYYNFMEPLLDEYMKVQHALESHNVREIAPMFAERNKELDAAFYHPPGTMEQKIISSLTDAANDPDLELVELKRDYVDFTLEDNRKLVSLTRSGLKAAIALNFKNGSGSQRYNLIFRYKNGKWILTR